ncbi:hypothetical protein MUU46_02400 [Scandinavium sp. TWS1a]|uniref:hypothetical protein n=1 Tax=Scandinavium tedordense TaxID=2926521 RepID=UPI002165D8F1|nr:hypothetical protein [Scandinavium tedordense]MCS2169182.1 hypothetical protein [Scandinavium tedordense]
MFLRNGDFSEFQADALSGENVWTSMNPLQRDMDFMNGGPIVKSHAILLLTLEEAEQVVDDLMGGIDRFFSYTAAPGNMKDGLNAFRNLSKLTTWYNPAQQLVFNLNILKVRAIEYKVGGKSYIKITGYPGLRRILTGTRYASSNPQMLEMAIGRIGIKNSITIGTKYCIYASLAWRAIELIFKSDYHLTDFLVDVSMDVVKILVSSVVIGVAAGLLTLISLPIVFTTTILVFVGIGLNIGLNITDDNLELSQALKNNIRHELRYRGYIELRKNMFDSLHSNSLLRY